MPLQDDASPLEAAAIDAADPHNTNIYIGNIAPETREPDLMLHFSQYGPVDDVKVGGQLWVDSQQACLGDSSGGKR